MAVESLYTTETPDAGSTDLADLGSGGTTAGSFQFAQDGSVSAGRFFTPVTLTGDPTFTVSLWEITLGEGSTSGSGTGTLLATKSVPAASLTAAAWNTVAYDAPVSVLSSKVYRQQVHNTAGRYVARAGVFATGPLVNGNITGPQSGAVSVGGAVVRNGTYRASATADQYASSYFNAPSYLVDLVYEASAGSNNAVLGAMLGSLTADLQAYIRPDAVLGALFGKMTAAMTMQKQASAASGDPIELEVNRANTLEFIRANPVLLALIPRTRAKTGSGTIYVDQAPRIAQLGRMIDQANPDTPMGADGMQRKMDFQLLLPYDGIVDLYDYWVDAAGVRCEVVELLPYNSYEVRAVVRRYGQKQV